jgi:PAS domain S-box-containing protein
LNLTVWKFDMPKKFKEPSMADPNPAAIVQVFMASLPGAVTLLDVDGKVLTWSSGARNITGYEAEEIEGRNFSCLYTPTDNSAGKLAASLHAAVAEGRHVETGLRVHKDGSEHKVQTMFMPLHDSTNQLVGFSSLMREASGELKPVRTGKTILVVDDDEEVRETVSRQLTSLGYNAIIAADGLEALDALACDSDIDLLFTDVVMPGGMGGREVAEEARLIRPGLKVLYTSGYFEGALLNNGSIDANAQLLPKPYRKIKLAEKILEALKSRA